MSKKKMEDFFNLPPADSFEDLVEEEEAVSYVRSRSELMEEAQTITAELTMLEKIDLALPAISDLTVHDREMDDISAKAITTFNDLVLLGGNVPDIHAGKIFEVAGQMLKTALEARNAKADKKIRVIEMQLKKARLDQVNQGESGGPRVAGEFDRNELMKYIVSNGKSENSDK